MMKFYKQFLLLSAVVTSFAVHSQTINPTTNGYVQESDGAYKVEQIYLRTAGGFNRTGFVVFPIKDLGAVYSASLNLVVKNFREDLGNPIAVDFHIALGDLVSPLANEANAYTSAPDTSVMSLAHTMTFDGTKDTDDIVSVDISKTLNELNADGAAEYVTIRINSDSSNAFLQFYSNAESDQSRWPSLEVVSEEDVVITTPVADGFLQKGKDFVTSDLYVRGQGTIEASFHREGYVVLAQNEQFGILDAKLKLTARVDAKANPAPDSIPQFIVSIAEGDLISDILNDGTTDWDQRPAESNFSVLDTLILNGVLAGETVEIDLTDKINSFIEGGTVDKYTIRMMDTTAHKVLARFHTSSDADEAKRPKLVVIASCAAELVEIDTIVCSTSVPFTLVAEEAANNVSVSENGVYDVLFKTPCGADLTRRYTVDIIDSGDFTENPEICAGEEFLGRTASETFVIEKVSSDGSCTEKITYNLTVNPLPEPDLGQDSTTILDDESIVLDAGSWESYSWSTGETTQTITVELASDHFVLGHNAVSVDVTDAKGCVGSDEVVVEIKDLSLFTTTKVPTLREDKDGFFDLGTRIEIKNDLYGDTQTPAGEGPFYNRIILMEFDASPMTEVIGEGVLTSAWVQMYNYGNDELPHNADLIHDTNVEVGAAVQPVDENWTWESQPVQGDYPIQDVALIKEESVPSFYTWDLTDFLSEAVIGANENVFSLRFSAREDTASTLIKFRSPSHSITEEQPRLIYEFSDKEVLYTGELKPKLMVYPNPSYDEIRLNAEFSVYSYSIVDMNGRVIQQSKINADDVKISVSHLERGIYILHLKTAEGAKSSRFIKK